MSIFTDSAQALIAAGIFFAALDLLIFGFATFILTLLGLAMVTTGTLLYFGVFEPSTANILISVAVTTAIYSLLLWKPLKRLQEQRQENKVSSDLTGMSFVINEDISPESPGKYHYSGIDWKVETQEVITSGTEVEVIDLQVGTMTVKTAQ